MSGDVQPRKRKDKKRKKEELGVEEPRGTAAALGEGDVFMHSYHDHGTGGHWCAKLIFFTLLAVLITLIGLIILENRGLTELEANQVESRYSAVFEGWVEEAPDDDHHDEHTLELKHPEEDEHDDDDENDDNEEEEIEHIEKEISEEEPVSMELPALPEEDDDDEDQLQDVSKEDESPSEFEQDDEDEDFLDTDNDEPPIEKITAPSGKPFDEIDDESSKQLPPKTLEEEEEYERRQEELRRNEEEQSSHKDGGGNSIEDMWPGEPSDPYWRQQLDDAEREIGQGDWTNALRRASSHQLSSSGRARWIRAVALDMAAEEKRDNRLLSQAIAAFLELLKLNDRLTDKQLLKVTARTLDRIRFRGTYLSAEPVYKILIRRFPNDPTYRNNLTVSFLMANRADLAEGVLKETLKKWPNDKVALVHYAFVVKTEHKRYKEAAELFRMGLEGDKGPACEPRFYYHYGDSLLLLGRFAEADEVHKRAAVLGYFLSPAQRSLYNVPRLKSRPWWDIEQTPYVKLARALEKSWKQILKEGEAARALYEEEKEGLRERGEWSQLDLFVRGHELPERCKRAPVTCSIVRTEPAAAGCRRGQIKFSLMEPGTHVRPHVGPTNCRLRMHLGLSNTKDTYIRVDQETRQWHEGKVLLFDDSFEHEVWHNGTASRLVLIVDVWHPDLTPRERRQLPAI